MPTVVECPGCGSCYQVSDRAVEKGVRCQCGQRLGGPPPAADSPDLPVDPAPPEKSEPAADAAPAPVPDTSPAAIVRRVREGIARRDLPMREVIALMCIGYGGVATLWVLTGLPGAASMGIILQSVWLARLVFAVLVVVSGALILKGHPHATACAGVSTTLLCFLPICGDVIRAFLLMSAVKPGALLVLLLRAAIVYPIPVWIIIWAVREETAKEKAESEEMY